MKEFTQLFRKIDETTKTNEKVEALVQYLNAASPEDKLWTIAIFCGRNPKKITKTNELKRWAAEAASIPYWLFDETYHVVGDLSETISSILPDGCSTAVLSLAETIKEFEAALAIKEEDKQAFITAKWKTMSKHERFVYNKLTSGSFRMGVSQQLLIKALAKHTGLHANQLAHRLTGKWDPHEVTYNDLLFVENSADEASRPYPFYLAYALDMPPEELGEIHNWQIEYKWDGIRVQLIKRNGTLFLWSRGEELITDKFPELHLLASHLPEGTVIDGELVPMGADQVKPFHELQTRIGRKNISKSVMQKVPVAIIAYDLLEINHTDQRNEPLENRRALLEELVQNVQQSVLLLSSLIEAAHWQELASIREHSRLNGSEGVMLKHKSSAYGVGRKKGEWWKWKTDPMSIDAVMIYAQSGHGRRAGLYTDYTFAVWDAEQKLVPFAKAYSGLTDKEIEAVDNWVKKHTIEKFGPVRSVVPELVFEIGFEGINYSPRHKSGIAVRFPRVLRWRKDKQAAEADTLEQLKSLIQSP
ncbi:MAG: ATP-dependent DNA ligase [Bacteroidota bacterium]|nr:ATP-dependent DNA ligase [Sphingobacteriales bacterium]